MASGPTLILSIRKGKEEARLVEVGMPPDVADSQLGSIIGLSILRLYNTIAQDGGKIRGKAVEAIRRWRD